jgi:hypothetical protein
MPGGGKDLEFTMIQDPTGKILKMEGMEKLAGLGGMGAMPGSEGMQQLMNPASNMTAVILPDRPLHLWEMWTPEPPEGMAKLMAAPSDTPLLRCWLCRIEKINGEECAKIRTRLVGSTDSEKMEAAAGGEGAPGMGSANMSTSLDSDMYTWIRVKDGKLMKTSGTANIAMAMTSPEKSDVPTDVNGVSVPSNFSMKMKFAVSLNPRVVTPPKAKNAKK